MLSGYIYLLEVIEPESSRFGYKYIGLHCGNNPWYFSSGAIIKSIVKKYGKGAFKRTILTDNVDNIELLNELEIHYIRLYNTYYQTSKTGLNLTTGGGGQSGYIHTDETKKKLSEINKGKKLSEEVKKKIGIASTGRLHTEETKKKISILNKGKQFRLGIELSEDHKKKISNSLLGHTGAMKGKYHTNEAKEKISKANKGRVISEEWKNRIGNSNSKTVLQYDKQGNFIREWISTKEVERELKICNGDIGKCCKGKLKTAGKYIWKYKNKSNKNNKQMIIEGNEQKEFTKEYYIGHTLVKIISINPTATEKIEKLGWKKVETEPNYISERDGIPTSRVEVHGETKTGEKFTHSFFLEKKDVVSKDGSKTQYVNGYGQTAWLTTEQAAETGTNITIVGAKGEYVYHTLNMRKAYKGEEELLGMLLRWLDIKQGKKFQFSNFESIFKGDFSELKSIVSNNNVGWFLGVKQTFGDDGQAKYSQVVYPKLFTLGYASAQDKPNPKNGGVYKGYVNQFTDTVSAAKAAGSQLNVFYGNSPYTFTKVDDVTKLPWLTGDNAATEGKKTEVPAF